MSSSAAINDTSPFSCADVEQLPGKGWNVIVRLYGPLERWFDKTRLPGEIEPVK